MHSLRVTVFGPVEVWQNDKYKILFRTQKELALFCYLVIETEHAFEKNQLAELFWPEKDQIRASSSLRQALTGVRKALHDSSSVSTFINIDSNMIQFNKDRLNYVDAVIFESLIQATRVHTHKEFHICEDCIKKYSDAIALYKGDFLENCIGKNCSEFYDWVDFNRQYYRKYYLEALHCLSDYYENEKEYNKAFDYAIFQLKVDYGKEDAHRQIIRILLSQGRRSEAIDQFEACKTYLWKNYKIKPDAKTLELHDLIYKGKKS